MEYIVLRQEFNDGGDRVRQVETLDRCTHKNGIV